MLLFISIHYREPTMKTELNNQPSPSIRFKLTAQNRGDELVIEIIKQKLYMLRRARDIIRDAELLSGFSQEDVARIGFTAGMEIANM
jgi:hypothetical protein